MSLLVCKNCQSEIPFHCIKCNECPDIDLCLQCFAVGAELGHHKKDHQYTISIGPVVGAFDCDVPWTLAEEAMLLDAVEQYGYGNWEDVASHVESKSPEQSEHHYNLYYIKGNIGKETFTSDPTPRVTDHTCPGGPLSPSISTPVCPLELSVPEQHALGYMPLRDDFEREHDNDAETLVSGLMINYDDDDLDIAVKLAQVERYRSILKERDRRKQLARTYGLITLSATAAAAALATSGPGVKFAKSSLPKPSLPKSSLPKSSPRKKRKSKEDKEFLVKMKRFAQCHSSKEHEEFIESHRKERDLKNRIKELVHFRNNGLTKLDEVEKYDEEKLKREKKKETKLKKLASISQAQRPSMGSRNAAVEENLDILIDESESKDDDDFEVTKEMSQCPGYEVLCKQERKLCSSLGISPANYMMVKTCIVKDYVQRRNGHPVKIRYPNGMDKRHRRQIMSFLADNCWIGLT